MTHSHPETGELAGWTPLGFVTSKPSEEQPGGDPTKPWTWDYAWDKAGISARDTYNLKQLVVGLVFLFVFAGFVAMMSYDPTTGSLGAGWLMIGFVGLFVLIIAGSLVYQVRQRKKYGVSRIRFARFPFHAGENAEVTLIEAPWLPAAAKVEATLRYVEEQIERRQSGKHSRNVVVAYARYTDQVKYSTDVLRQMNLTELPIRFQIPTDAKTSRLHTNPPAYWDLEVHAATEGVDYEAHFLMPIYAVVPAGTAG